MIKREDLRYGADGMASSKAVSQFGRALVVAGLLPALAWWSGPVAANPRGGSIVHGDVKIGAGAGGMLDIRQNSRNAIINWESFSIDAGELNPNGSPRAELFTIDGIHMNEKGYRVWREVLLPLLDPPPTEATSLAARPD